VLNAAMVTIGDQLGIYDTALQNSFSLSGLIAIVAFSSTCDNYEISVGYMNAK